MQSAKNRIKVLSALSMAAAATFAVKSANAASLSLYYGNTTGTNNGSSDGIFIGTGISQVNGTAKGNLAGASAVSGYTPGQTTPLTVTVPVGDYLSISVNALVTNNPNPDGGVTESTPSKANSVVEPANMGLATLGMKVPSSDATGAILQPVNSGGQVTTYNSVPGYNSYAIVNGTTANPGGPAIPNWNASTVTPGDVEQNDGSVGLNTQIFGGNTGIVQTATGMQQLQQFSASSAAYSNSTEFFRGLVYNAKTTGTVTLSPFADTAATQYWSVLTTAGANSGTTAYQATYFGSNDTVGSLPVLVIDVTGGTTPPTSHAILSLTSSAPTSYGSSSGTLTPSGHNGSYSLSQITGLSDVTNYVEALGWNPTTDEEIYGLDVLVNGVQANSTQLQTLINAINGDGIATASSGVAASTTPIGGLPSNYDLFLTYAGGGPANPDFLGVDLSSSNDSNLVGYSFSAVAAVPEPMSLGLLAVGGLGLMTRRSRRKA